jgi:hypothetical protein
MVEWMLNDSCAMTVFDLSCRKKAIYVTATSTL